MTRILVTGGAGFFGHHVVEHLLKSTDYSVVVLDKLSYASKGFDRLRDIGVYDDTRITRLTLDLSAGPPSEGIVYEIGSVDFVVHLAAETHVDNSIQNPRAFVLNNVVGTFEILELARTTLRPKAFIYFSTDEVFGPAARSPLNVRHSGSFGDHFHLYREWDRYNSTNPYSATKAGGEELALAYANTYSIPVIITHCMNLFGERQHPEKFIPHVISKVLDGAMIDIHADRECKTSGSRSYIHARNAADAVLFLIRKSHLLHDAQGRLREKVNIAGQREISNLELAEFIANHVGAKLHARLVDYHSSRPGHDLRYALDGSKLVRAGWKAPVDFDVALRKTIDWYMANPAWLRA